MAYRRGWGVWIAGIVACGPSVGPIGVADGTATGGGTTGSTSAVSEEGSTGGGESMDGADTTAVGSTGGPLVPPEPRLDVLFVIDDSPSMRDEQTNVARNLVGMMETLLSLTDGQGNAADVDAQIMVTHTSAGGPGCDDSTGGEPVTVACIDRLDAFEQPAACETVCPEPVVPDGDFVVFGPEGDNVDLSFELDLDGDGEPESAATRAVACIGPQGAAGCPYASPLEAMRRALDLDAPWNNGPEPFLRDDVPLAIIVISDGVDCSGVGAEVLAEETYWEVDPATGLAAPSPAVCWNAGVHCEGPDADGLYADCSPTGSPLTSTAAYLELLEDLRSVRDKETVMIGALGVPPVTLHNEEAPFHPVEGGVFALQPRVWADEDLLPADVEAGLTIADKHFATGVGPGCTELGRDAQPLGQASPPPRIIEVCEGLNRTDENGDPVIRCCLESICDDDFSFAINCLTPPPFIVLPG